MQPSHAISDKRWAQDRLGEYRVQGAYAWHMMRSFGVHVPFGTDWPVEPINPYLGLYAAVTRRARKVTRRAVGGRSNVSRSRMRFVATQPRALTRALKRKKKGRLPSVCWRTLRYIPRPFDYQTGRDIKDRSDNDHPWRQGCL